tara:strand:+ start:1564 stop:2145 length:582 start_codon:yes stop_codon:yes gene_type:complete
MFKKKIEKIFFLILVLVLVFSSIIVYLKFFKIEKVVQITAEEKVNEVYSSNLIEDVKYTTRDADGNEFIITAQQGEIDYSNSNILYLTKVKGLIKLANSNNITITSKFGKYNSENFDTIFSKNVIINYLDNKITGEYLDFSLERNSMLISKKVVYTNLNNILKADVIEINIETKDIKIFMYENQKKVNIKTKN